MKVRLFLLIGFLIILTGIRWWFAANVELSPDESYHYLWAQHPDISYYSKGPGVALAILAGTSLFGPGKSRFLVCHNTESAACF